MNEKKKDSVALLEQIKSAIPSDKSYIFSIISLLACDAGFDDIIASGAVSCHDTMGEADVFVEELLEQESDARSIDVVSHVFSIGQGESENMPNELVKLVVEYGLDEFIVLDEVDQIARNDFSLDASDYGY